MMMKSVVFVTMAIVISGGFIATVDAVGGKFQLTVVIIKSQIEFSLFIWNAWKVFFLLVIGLISSRQSYTVSG